MGQILFENGFIVTMDETEVVYDGGSLLVEEDRIVAVGKVDPDLIHPDAERINLQGKYLLPGFVNTHVHTSQQISRGVGDDVDIITWLRDRMWPFEKNMTPEDSYISTLACCLELIKSGVTSFAEPGGQFVPSMAKAVSESGLRGKLAKSVMDCGEGRPDIWYKTTDEELEIQLDNFKNYHNTAEGRVQIWFGLRTIFNNSDELICRTKELADAYNVGIHMHVAEAKEEIEYTQSLYGEPTVTHLNRLGILDKNLLAVHTVWLTNEEVDLFAQHQVKVSHNPAAAMKVLGFAKIPQMIRKNICVTIGTDGASCNNRMDIVDEMWLTSLIHKGWRLESTVVPAEEILRMVTKNGAKALLDEALYGSLEAGKKADLIVINPSSASMLPLHDKIAALVTAMHSENIESSMCNGRWLMKNRQVLTLDEKAILKASQEHGEAIYRRGNIILPQRFPIIKL